MEVFSGREERGELSLTIPYGYIDGKKEMSETARLTQPAKTVAGGNQMAPGTVVSIHITPTAGAPVSSVKEVRAVPGKGLEGDRYFDGTGTFSTELPQPDHELTLVEIEKLEDLKREQGVEIAPGDTRRNIVTRGVSLNDLVGKEVRIGEVRIRGLRLCEPCNHLAKLLNERKVLYGLVHKCGLRAQILTGGIIHIGDAIEVES